MLTIEQFLDSCAHETRIIQHLAGKLSDEQLDFRPTETQRTMRELVQYLPRMALAPMAYLQDGNWDRAPSFGEGMESITLANFAEEMDRQLEQVRAMAESQIGRTQAKTAMPWGEPCTVGQFLVNAVIKTYAAYRMQFFDYCKGAGLTELNSANCWMGIDR